MKLKKMLAWFLTLCMMATALPVTAFAEDDPADPTDAVAYIAHDVKEYVHGDLQKAFDNYNDCSILLLKDYEGDVEVKDGSSYTFYLNGHTMTGTFKLTDGHVNFKGYLAGDTESGAESKIINTGLEDEYPIWCGSGQFNLSGDVQVIATGDDGIALYAEDNKLNVDSENVVVNGGVKTSGEGVINITNGTYNGPLYDGSGSLNIGGGKFKVDPSASLPSGFEAKLGEDGYYTMVAKEVSLSDLETDAEGAYLISDAEDVIIFRTLLSTMEGKPILGDATFKLTKDIDMKDKELPAVGNDNSRFGGTFDGQGYKIENVNIVDESSNEVAFFGNIYGATIKDLTLHNVTVKGGDFVAGLAGKNRGSVIDNCAITGDIDITGDSYVGGILGGGNSAVEITDCSVEGEGTISGTSAVGGIAGSVPGGSKTVTGNTVADITIEAENGWAGGIAGFVQAGPAEGISLSNNGVSDVTIKVEEDADGYSNIIAGRIDTTNSVKLEGNIATGSKLTVAGEEKTDLYDAGVTTGGNATITTPVAMIGAKPYTSLQAAIDAAEAGTGDVTITLLADVTTEDKVLITQKEGLNLTIDGGKNTFTGSLIVYGHARYTGDETLTIKNINFVDGGTSANCIWSPRPEDVVSIYTAADRGHKVNGEGYNYSHNVTVDNCTFSATEGNTEPVVAVRHGAGGDVNWTIKNCVADNIFGLLQASGTQGVTITDCKVTDVKEGMNLNNSDDVEITGCEIDATEYAVRTGASNVDEFSVDITLEDNKITSEKAAIILRASAPNVDLEMSNNAVVAATHIDATGIEDASTVMVEADANYWGKDAEGKTMTAPVVSGTAVAVDSYYKGYDSTTGKLTELTFDETKGFVAAIGGKGYTDLQEAIKDAAPDGTVEVLDDVTVDTWIMFAEELSIGNGKLITLHIDGLTINGNNHTLTVKSIESAGNGNCLFYDAENLNINDLTINLPATGANGIGLQSGTIENVTINGGVNGIYPQTGDVTIEGCTFNTNGTAIYFEEERDGLTVTGNTFKGAGNYAIMLRGDVEYTDNNVESGKVNVVSGAPVVTGNDFNDVRFKVYNDADATIKNNKINNLVFNDETKVESTFENNTLSAAAAETLKGMDVENVITPAPSTGGGSSKPKYTATVDKDDIENGSVKLSSTRVKAGSTVTITVTPDEGYELDELKVLDKDGNEVELTDKGNGKFTFKMPKGGVEVDASFVPENGTDAPVVKEDSTLVLTIGQLNYQEDGTHKVNDVSPIIKGDRTMLPIRLIAEFLGATVTWNEAEQSVTIVEGDTTIVIYIGQAFALVNGEPVQLDAPAFIQNDRTYLPVRFIAENLGATVTWDGTANTVTIVG